MGTTQRINNGPNWGSISIAVTSVAKAINDLNQIDDKEISKDDEVKKDNIAKKEKKLEDRKNKHILSVLDRLIKIGGGSKKISSGKSNVIGRSGIKSSNKLASFLYNINNIGLEKSLSQIGFIDFKGKTTKDIIDYLINYFTDETIGMDEAAAKSAIYEVMKGIENEVDEENNSLEGIMSSYVESDKLSELLSIFFGKYIYEYLWERFQEKLSQKKGEKLTRETFDSIQKEINSRVQLLNSNKKLSKIDWSGSEGKLEIEKIFEAIIKIEE